MANYDNGHGRVTAAKKNLYGAPKVIEMKLSGL
jgi:hypothetical protein